MRTSRTELVAWVLVLLYLGLGVFCAPPSADAQWGRPTPTPTPLPPWRLYVAPGLWEITSAEYRLEGSALEARYELTNRTNLELAVVGEFKVFTAAGEAAEGEVLGLPLVVPPYSTIAFTATSTVEDPVSRWGPTLDLEAVPLFLMEGIRSTP